MSTRLRAYLHHMFGLTSRRELLSAQEGLKEPTRAILYRILADNLPGVGTDSVTLSELRFILEHEKEYPNLQKRWLLNRITDSHHRQQIIELLEQHNQIWTEIPFEDEAYSQCWTDIGAVPNERHPWSPIFSQQSKRDQSEVLDYVGRSKSLYLLNGNSACNHALTEGWNDAPWVFAWAGCCYLTGAAWQVILPLLDLPNLTYISIPTAFVSDERELLQSDDVPPLLNGMPLLGLARQPSPLYGETRRLTTGSETDLISRLGLIGTWSGGLGQPCTWEGFETTPRGDRAQMVQAGWAYRLGSSPSIQIHERQDAIRTYARKIDIRLIGEVMERQSLRCWTGLSLEEVTTPGLAAIAANARSVPPVSVTDKPDALPGAPERSYVNAVPHWQSLAGSESALDRSGLLGSAGPLCGDVSQHYDRARLQLMIDCVCTLSLDAQLNANQASRDHAAQMLRSWFINPATAMIPDGAYARLSAVDPSRNVLDAAIDFRDLYPLLDAITLLQRGGSFSLAESQQLEEWFDAFLSWLASDSITFLQQHSASPACTWYHLLMLAIAAYRGRKNVAAQVFDNLPGLLARQFRADGSPQSCTADAQLRHEHLFNLQAWSNLVVLSSALGRDLLAFTDSNGIGLQAVFAHADSHLPTADQQDSAPALHPGTWLQAMQVMTHRERAGELAKLSDLPPLAEASSGLPPFWSLCRAIPTTRLPSE
jgi:hypothetical protein